jgi:hypothetical protein
MAEPEKCVDGECCVQIGPVGHCKSHLEEDKLCKIRPVKNLMHNHVYKHMCPCGTSMECRPKDGALGNFNMGKCA